MSEAEAKAPKGRPLYEWALLALGTIILIGWLSVIVPLVPPRGEIRNETISPVKALTSVPPEIAVQPVFNDMTMGGHLIFNKIKVYIDTRMEFYPRAFVAHYFTLIEGRDDQAVRDELAKWNVAWTIFPPSSRINDVMRRQVDWCLYFADEAAIVFIRRAALMAVGLECSAHPMP